MKIVIRCLLCFLTLSLLLVQSCFSQDKRLSEIKTELLAVDNNNAHMALIDESINSYKSLFSATKNNLVAILTSKSGDDIEDEWKKLAKTQGGYAKAHFQSFTRKVNSNDKLIKAFNDVAQQEEKFWSQVAGSGVPIYVGEIDILTKLMLEEISSLHNKWNFIIDKKNEFNRQVDQQEEDIKDAEDIYKKTASLEQKAADAFTEFADDLADRIAKLTKEYAKLPNGAPRPTPPYVPDDVFGPVWSTIKTIVKNLDSAVMTYNISKVKIKRKLYGDDYVIGLYWDTRKEVHEFIQKNGYDIAKQYFKDLESSINTLQSVVSTSAQKNEIDSMKDQIKKAASSKLEKAENAYLELVDKNKEKFMSALSESSWVVEQLLDYSARKKVQRNSNAKDIDERLRALSSNIQNIESKFNTLLNSEYLNPSLKREVADVLSQFIKAYKTLGDAPLGEEIELVVNKYHEKLLKKLLR